MCLVPSYDKVELTLAKECRGARRLHYSQYSVCCAYRVFGCVHCVGQERVCLRKKSLTGCFAPVCVFFG
jgi:hypothetical protein